MGLSGRGTNYSRTRGLTEVVLTRFYGSGWAARLARRAGFQRKVRVVRRDVYPRAWPAGARPLRIAFGSDFHAGPTTHPRLLEAACRALADARPDVLLLGGDFVFLDARHIDSLAPLFAAIPAPLGRYAVLGNHDLWADDARIARALERAGIELVINRCVGLPAPYEHVSICGLDDPWVGSPNADAAFEGAREVRVVLMHAPAGLLAISERRFDVAFCGHTHGGHIALPGGIPIVAPGHLSREFSSGAHRVGPHKEATLLVSRGVGGIEVPVRVFADPDVVVCELR